MKNNIILGYILTFQVLFSSCTDEVKIGDEFIVSEGVDELYRNVYYRRQGIFHDFSVNKVIYDDKTILVRGYGFSKPQELDSSHYMYYLIVKEAYTKHPDQINSPAVKGPFSLHAFDSISSTMRDPKILEWHY